MSFNLSDVKGVGKKEDTLKEAGIDTVEKLANAKADDLTSLKGIGKATAAKIIENAKTILNETIKEDSTDIAEENSIEKIEEEKVKEVLKKLEQKKLKLQGKKVEEGSFILVKLTGRTQKGTIFRVSSEEDAKKAGMYDEKKAEQGFYTPEFVIVGKPGFLNDGLTEIIKEMNYFEKKSVRIPPSKAFGKRDPQKIERMGIAKFRKINEGKNPILGQEFSNKKGQRGVITNVVQGRVIIDYNHPLAGQSIDYNLEIIDKIEDFDAKLEFFMINKGIPKENVSEFKIEYMKEDKILEITIPKTFLFQNLTYVKFGLAMDLQTHMAEEINDVKFIEVYEKIPLPATPSDSVMKKVEEFNKKKEENKENTEEQK
ncbi:MAG: putative FKBP-type peptidyl-prolyl cis-trans isomerase [Candidatus Lokiarchaeum sp. GC14_75]|nr:MAG: putative FKBP-type peptidyl-prolyl cis-trans isomerase [Candidatus Lokiarchaeum sp. GC14_75]